MALTSVLSFGPDYASAEKFADEWAGDTNEHAAVVEDFDLGQMLVMDYAAAETYVMIHDAEIQYDANNTIQDLRSA